MKEEAIRLLLIPSSTTIKEAMKRLIETAEKILFVAEADGCLRGTITDGDIRRGIINGLGFGAAVESVMNTDFISVHADIPDIESLCKELMLEHSIEQLPVIDASGKVVEVVVWTDLLKLDEGKRAVVQSRTNRVVIMAGGKGKRMHPVTHILPKPLIPIGTKSIIEHIMESFAACGFENFIYTLNYKKEYIKLFLKERNFPYNIECVEEETFLGTAGSLSLLKQSIDETFFVVNCDTLLDVDFAQILEWHREHKAAMTIVGSHSEVKIPFGVLELSGGKLDNILEKPVHDIIINTGLYVIEPHLLDMLPTDTYMDMDKLIKNVLKNETISVYPIYNGWTDFGQLTEFNKSMEKFEG